jgi:hypothetical protein
MATMMTTRRAMPPSMSAREREVLVVGRSYAPALLGWCSAMYSSLTWNPRSSSSTLGTPDCGASHPGVGLAMLKGNCHAKRCCFPSETRQVSVREEEAGVCQRAWEAPVHDRLQLHTSE